MKEKYFSDLLRMGNMIKRWGGLRFFDAGYGKVAMESIPEMIGGQYLMLDAG
jgi:hypothetical protein